MTEQRLNKHATNTGRELKHTKGYLSISQERDTMTSSINISIRDIFQTDLFMQTKALTLYRDTKLCLCVS